MFRKVVSVEKVSVMFSSMYVLCNIFMVFVLILVVVCLVWDVE